MSTFAEWKKLSKLMAGVNYLTDFNKLERLCHAAYKAGERQGRKDAGEMAKREIKFHAKVAIPHAKYHCNIT